MSEIFQQIRQWIELIYFISGAMLAGAALYGLQQIRIMKRDMQVRSERAAAEKAIEYITRYVSLYIPLDNKFYDECVVKKLDSYDGPVSDFKFESLPPHYLNRARERFALYSFWLPPLNELNTIAAAFAFGVADEKIGFSAIGRSFCAAIAWKYDVICCARRDKVCPHFEGIVTLYRLWAPRISKDELTALRQEVDRKLMCLGNETG